MTKKQKGLLGAIVAVVAFIWINSMMPQLQSQGTSDGVRALLLRLFPSMPEFFFLYIRKVGHFTEYFVLGSLLALYLSTWGKVRLQRLWNGFSTALVVAVADESIQIFSGRGPAVSDVLIDIGGATCGLLLLLGAVLLLRRRKKANHPV